MTTPTANPDAVAPPPSSAVAPPDDRLAETAFVLYVAAAGDVIAVARHLGITLPEVRTMARRGQWDQRVRSLAHTGDIGDLEPADFEAAQIVLNRGINFVQAHRLRSLADRALTELSAASSVMDQFTDVKGGVDTKPLADIARIIELSHRLTAQALGDLTGAGIRAPGRQPMGRPNPTPPGGGRASVSVGKAMGAALDV